VRRSSPYRIVVAAALGLLAACNGGSKDEPKPTRIRWTHQAAPDYYASAALSLDQHTVYFGTSGSDAAPPGTDQGLLALSAADGSVRWTYPLGTGEVRSTPAVAPDGSISFVVERRDPGNPAFVNCLLHRLSAGGSLQWTFDVNLTGVDLAVGLSAPAIGGDGTVYVAGDRLYAISPVGNLRWTVLTPMGEALHASPVIGNNTVYFAAHNVPLTAFSPASGNVLWSVPLGWNDFVFASPAIGADGTLYVASHAGVLFAVSAAGVPRWEFDVASVGFSGSLRSSPAVGADGSLYFGITQANRIPALFSLTSQGALRWTFVPADLPADVPVSHLDIYSSPALGADGIVYFGHEFGRVYAVGAADGRLRWVQEVSQGITWSSPALATDGTLFIGDLSGGHYAIDTGGTGLELTAPWPKYRGDLQNSGRRH
jgi:outer membrane protein assembly factor BamB